MQKSELVWIIFLKGDLKKSFDPKDPSSNPILCCFNWRLEKVAAMGDSWDIFTERIVSTR